METTPTYKPRILLADDHRLMLDSFSVLFANQFEVHVADTLEYFKQSVNKFSPDLAILDIRMPDGDSFAVAQGLLQLHPELKLMFLSMHSETKFVKRAAEIGACGYIPKCSSAQELLFAVQTILKGGKYLKVPESEIDGQPGDQIELTQRQTEVLRLISQGSSAKDIANNLNISVRTAEFHRAAIMERLNMHSTALMTRYAVEQGIS